MPVQTDASGRRSVAAEVEVPGTPEEVWRAVATGPGISSWFVPTEVDGREGGSSVSHFGPGDSMDSVAVITAWDPPRRFEAETTEGPGTVTTEWSVEARPGDTCIVRVRHGWSAGSDEWDSQFEGHEQGWVAFFRILRLYLTHFRGQACSAFQVMGVSAQPSATAWDGLVRPLGLAGVGAGQPAASPPGAPPLAGVVERAGPPEHPELLLRLDRPAPGLAHLFALPMGGQTYLPMRIFLYGETAAAVAADAEPAWRAWMDRQFPPT